MLKNFFYKNTKNGFSLVEMMIVLAIMAIITVALFFNYGKFSSNAKLGDLAYQVALSIRQAQSFGINVLGSSSGDFDIGYGVYFNNNSSYILFEDKNKNLKYDAPDSIKEQYTMPAGYSMTNICSTNDVGVERCIGGSPPISYLNIVFRRSNTEAYFNTDKPGLYTSAVIEITSPDGDSREVDVLFTGVISISS